MNNVDSGLSANMSKHDIYAVKFVNRHLSTNEPTVTLF